MGLYCCEDDIEYRRACHFLPATSYIGESDIAPTRIEEANKTMQPTRDVARLMASLIDFNP